MSHTFENWYVYYPAPVDTTLALPLLRQMQQQLAEHCSIRARIEERVGAGAAPTWMEVYEGVSNPEHFAASLQAGVGAIGLNSEQAASRRVERFRRL